MPKYYVALVDLGNNQMRVPVKAALNPYNHQPAYCAGMPQFFGGTDDNDQPPPVVMEAELTQESRRTLELTSGSPHSLTHSGGMFFYYALEGQWVVTGTPWGPAANPSEQEMDRLVTVDLTLFNTGMNDQAIINELVRQTGSNLQTNGGTDFNQSATRPAFIALIRGYLAGTL